ncbi:hypothetical protein PMAYCL1PPCAC_25776, partial [Pristionchus mayeri]
HRSHSDGHPLQSGQAKSSVVSLIFFTMLFLKHWYDSRGEENNQPPSMLFTNGTQLHFSKKNL